MYASLHVHIDAQLTVTKTHIVSGIYKDLHLA